MDSRREAKDCGGKGIPEVKTKAELSQEEWETAGCPAVMSWKMVTHGTL